MKHGSPCNLAQPSNKAAAMSTGKQPRSQSEQGRHPDTEVKPHTEQKLTGLSVLARERVNSWA